MNMYTHPPGNESYNITSASIASKLLIMSSNKSTWYIAYCSDDMWQKAAVRASIIFGSPNTVQVSCINVTLFTAVKHNKEAFKDDLSEGCKHVIVSDD